MFQGILEFPHEFPGLRETCASEVRLEVVCAIPEFVITISFFFSVQFYLCNCVFILCIYFEVLS